MGENGILRETCLPNRCRFTLTDTNSLDPRNLAVYGIPGGMLPQANAVYETLELRELSILVQGEEDGSFDVTDRLMFYVDGPDQLIYSGSTYRVSKNLYSDQVYYFITVKDNPGTRIDVLPSMVGEFTEVNFYDQVISQESDECNILGSGREWYGERLDTETPLTFSYPVTGLVAGRDITVNFTGMAQSFTGSAFDLELNGNVLGNMPFSSIPDQRYGIKGNERNTVFTMGSEAVQGSSLELSVQYDKMGTNNAVAYINRFTVTLPKQLTFESQQFNFRSAAALEQPVTNFQITTSNQQAQVWNVTDPINPVNQELTITQNQASFATFSNQLEEYVAFTPSDLPAPASFESIANQDLAGATIPDLLIIAPEIFRAQAERLANFRRSHDGLEVLVTSPEAIYNEFSGGRQDVSAIRNFARHLFGQNKRFKYLLLFGKGSYDYKDRIATNSNYVPTYEARNSLHPLLSYSSDDYFGFLDEDEGEWIESASGDHLMDIGVGRIPATTLEQATIAVDKIIDYQTNPSALGDWRSKLVFVADDGDRNIHQRDADQLATLIDTTFSAYNVQKLYLDAFEQETRPNGQFSPQAENALLNAAEEGALVINFTGHGAETGWMQERVLTLESIDEWQNRDRLPLLVTATCEFGRNDDPLIFSGAEKMMFKDDGGALALVTTARPVFSSTNYDLNLAFYGSILNQENGQYQRLGDIIRFTKNNSLNGSLNRNFILLGDPSMRLAYPQNQIRVTAINNNPINLDQPDTLSAMQPVTISGNIMSGSQVLDGFNGTVQFSLLDKSSELQTLGTESDIFHFDERNSRLFNGSATVENGQFELQFVVPRNINYQFGSGKMTLYAVNNDQSTDALGASVDFVLGGTYEGASDDQSPPLIRPFLNDTLPVNSYFIKPDADLLLLLEDENGINISKSGIGQDITATLNDSVTFVLNDFYNTATDNFRKGSVSFPLRNLPVGENRLSIKAWDTFNNSSEAELIFFVTGENSTEITEINAYPNPFNELMTFTATHNSAGEPLEMVVEVYNNKGEHVTSLYKSSPVANNVERIVWDGTDNTGSLLPKGIYIYNIQLRSDSQKIALSSRKKLIISN